MIKFWGKVKKGKKRGKALGFPTANINLYKKIDEGVYVSLTKLSGKIYPSLTFVGKAKTFNESKYQAESHILDFNKDIYNQSISIILLKKLRGNKRFTNAKILVEQMKKDEKAARKYFKKQ